MLLRYIIKDRRGEPPHARSGLCATAQLAAAVHNDPNAAVQPFVAPGAPRGTAVVDERNEARPRAKPPRGVAVEADAAKALKAYARDATDE